MEIRAFKAFRFNEDVVGDAGSCISPPYDVIDADQQEKLYRQNPYNIVRIIKGKTEPSDNRDNNQYTRAAQYLKSWMEKGVLKQDSKESIYAYIQDFELAGANLQRISFIAKARLEPVGQTVKDHEQTLDGPLTDRMNLIKATCAVFGLVFMLYEDPDNNVETIVKNIEQQPPLLDHLDEQNTRHRLLAITSGQQTEKIINAMRNKICIIADGHHRYETALGFAKQNPRARYQMLAFSNIHGQGPVILACHRLIGNVENLSFEELFNRLNKSFEITKFRFNTPKSKKAALEQMLAKIKAEHERNKNAFGIYGQTGCFYSAVLKDKQLMNSAAPDKSVFWRALDVAVLRKLVIEKHLRLDENSLFETNKIKYVKDTAGATDALISEVDAGKKQLAFFMNPVKPKQFLDVVNNSERMPQKSTYFYPKVYSGLAIDKL